MRSPPRIREPGPSTGPGTRRAPANGWPARTGFVSQPGQGKERLRIQADHDIDREGDADSPGLPAPGQAGLGSRHRPRGQCHDRPVSAAVPFHGRAVTQILSALATHSLALAVYPGLLTILVFGFAAEIAWTRITQG